MSKEDVLKMIKDEDAAYVDIRFTDPRGKLQHVTVMSDLVDEDFLDEGFMFDGSSIAGWKGIEASDMKLMPDTESAYVDPFYAEKTICMHCTVVEPDTGEPYDRDPRGTAEKAEAYLKSSGIGDVAYFGPEAEFFLFDDVRFSNTMNKVSYEVDAQDAPGTPTPSTRWATWATARASRAATSPSTRPTRHGPALRDAVHDEAHRHEGRQAPPRGGVVPARAWPDLRLADQAGGRAAEVQVRHPQRGARLRQVGDLHAQAHRGRQRHRHALQHVDLEGRQAALRRRQVCRSLGRGAVVHRRHPEARQDAERLHQPVHQLLQAPDPRLRGPGSARLLRPQPLGLRADPVDGKPQGQARRGPLPRPVGEPLPLLRGTPDGRPRRDREQDPPRRASDKDLYDLPPEELAGIPTVCASLREALDALEADHDFLLKGGVFTKDQIEGYMELKWEEVYAFEHTPHPVEYGMYYSC
jgi:glutamine synthetase